MTGSLFSLVQSGNEGGTGTKTDGGWLAKATWDASWDASWDALEMLITKYLRDQRSFIVL
jgi:hypothetical protein